MPLGIAQRSSLPMTLANVYGQLVARITGGSLRLTGNLMPPFSSQDRSCSCTRPGALVSAPQIMRRQPQSCAGTVLQHQRLVSRTFTVAMDP